MNTSEHIPDRPIGNTAYQAGCRCDGCREAAATTQREYRARKSGHGPRPPGVVWVDDSGLTQVVRCERCRKNYGAWVLDKPAAKEFVTQHAYLHRNDEPFDWSAYDESRLIKNPGGRPPLDERPLCSDELCTEPVHARGLCGKHYKRLSRGGYSPSDPEFEGRPALREALLREAP